MQKKVRWTETQPIRQSKSTSKNSTSMGKEAIRIDDFAYYLNAIVKGNYFVEN
jgi:hypothetical protein